ncbi:uncharacterized protein MICPUCDRAFT_35061 [Micromonas pusilla CCMP1545]|uniref:Predicted protein n=1 Tax=Micromonas pusilla (strain CCMP1545) TaxID=564608 RepID=C1MZV6_MICPC|nr:uncharacterized protein MICPUCDRAFT_35061 [Micromonas pusilla CCMP1545]EEH54671.1 predicted protein [Micromonas pusilla CCMP1545]|eukprot:XP_003061021.1 predicted protein [Micromonas pusilla CCMP1545]
MTPMAARGALRRTRAAACACLRNAARAPTRERRAGAGVVVADFADDDSRRRRASPNHLRAWRRDDAIAGSTALARTASTRRCARTFASTAASAATDAHAPASTERASPSRSPPRSLATGNFTRDGSLPSFDYTALLASALEISRVATPTKVEIAVQGDAYSVVLGLRGLEGNAALHLSWHPNAASVRLGPPPPRVHKSEQLAFGERMNATLRGLILTRVTLPERWERVATFEFAERPGGDAAYRVHAEIMARNSNVVLVDARDDDKIVACAYQVGAAQTSVRPISPGFKYAPPPAAPGVDPDAGLAATEWRELVAAAKAAPGISKGLVRAFRGVSPALAAALASSVGVDPKTNTADVADDDWIELHRAWLGWIESATSAAISDVPTAGDGSGPVGALFSAVYGDAGDADVFRRERDRLLQGVRAALKKTTQKAKNFREQIELAEKHESVKIQADELMAYQHGWTQGQDTMEVYDFESGEARRVAVDPQKGPLDAAEKLYKKARKQRRTATQVEPLLEAASNEMAYLENVEFALTELTSEDALALEEINLELVDAKLMAPGGGGTAPKKRNRRKEETMANVRTYVAPGGSDILVGRNSKGNEAVSLKLGSDHDVWFHVRGAPGAHVVLRLDPGQTATDVDMQAAADLAAFHSKVRTGGKVDVSYTSPKFVRKPSGARLGMVTIDKEKVMTGRPDDSVAAEEERREAAAGGGKKGREEW